MKRASWYFTKKNPKKIFKRSFNNYTNIVYLIHFFSWFILRTIQLREPTEWVLFLHILHQQKKAWSALHGRLCDPLAFTNIQNRNTILNSCPLSFFFTILYKHLMNEIFQSLKGLYLLHLYSVTIKPLLQLGNYNLVQVIKHRGFIICNEE